MTDRKKKGLGLIISGVVWVLVGVVLMVFTQTPQWVAIVVQIVAAISGVLGIVFVAPDQKTP